MADNNSNPIVPVEAVELMLPQHDGTSQADRDQAALSPDSLAVDERSLKDLLIFASKYAKELRYFGVKNDSVADLGDWSAFLDSDLDNLDKIVAFVQDPTKVTVDEAQRYSRPHFALFLTFLQLLRHAQDQLNTLTSRHLDFYYQQVLRMTKQPATPHQVNVLVDLTADTEEYELKSGTLLNGGTDKLGQSLFYSTDRDIVVNQAQVAQLSSVYADNRITTIKDARGDKSILNTDVFLDMMRIALGDPNPGNDLQLYPPLVNVKANLEQQYPIGVNHVDGVPIDENLLGELRALVNFVLDTQTGLAMSFGDLRRLIQFKHERDTQGDEDWQSINAILEKGGKNHLKDLNFHLSSPTSRDFITNLIAVVGSETEYKSMFSTVSIATNIYDAYALLDNTDAKTQNDILKAIDEHLGLSSDDFKAMMYIKVRVIDSQWAEINRILLAAGQKKHNSLDKFPPDPDKTSFEDYLKSALGTITYPKKPELINNIDDYFAALRLVERFFFMSAENITYLLSIVRFSTDLPQSDATSSEQWEKVYGILEDAHTEKVYEQRRQALNALNTTNLTDTQKFSSMASLVLDDSTGSATSDQIAPFLSAADWKLLGQIYPGKKDEPIKWDDVIAILERAERARLPVPNAEFIEWQNLYAAEDATSVKVTLSVAGDDDQSRWKTFGREQSSTLPPLEFGWAISSPILALSQGDRTITLTLVFDDKQFNEMDIRSQFKNVPQDSIPIGPINLQPNSGPFRIQVSTKKGWVQPDAITLNTILDYPLTVNGSSQNYPALEFELDFGEKVDPIETLGIADSQISSQWPMLRLMLRQIWQPPTNNTLGRYVTKYQPFRNLELLDVKVNVDVSGLVPLQIQNDESLLNPTKPFEPFGVRPAAGSHFYLGDPELVTKTLDSLSFNFQWMGAPSDLAAYYANYPAIHPATGPTNDFTVRISMIDSRAEVPLILAAELFDSPFIIATTPKMVQSLDSGKILSVLKTNFRKMKVPLSDDATVTGSGGPWKIVDGDKSYTIELGENSSILKVKLTTTVNDITIDDVPAALGTTLLPISDPIYGDDLLDWIRYIQWELNEPDFQHEAYPALAASKAVELAADIVAASATKGSVTAASYKVNPPYTPKMKNLSVDYTSTIEVLIANYDPGAAIDQIFHIEPFGYDEVFSETATPHYSFLPQYNAVGELYIGIQNLRPPQNLSLLLQMAEGSADPDLEPVPIHWSYLDHNRWISLDEGNVLRDSTRGLINSGIIEFSLIPAQTSTVLPDNLYWLRAEIARNSNSVCDMVAIHTQAVSTTFINQANAPDYLKTPLAAGSITKLVESVPQISGIRQPYTSYGGNSAEETGTFNRRISERLRHKQRALTLWDYERLILERFPQLYKVKCLPATATTPGLVEIIVIPDIKNKIPFDPFEPKAPADLIADIEAYLQNHIPPFATVKVKNAFYEPVQVRFDVRFMPGYNESYFTRLLNDELNQFLSPWAYSDSADIVIGGRIYANSIINFVEKRPYVDFVANIELFTKEDGIQFTISAQHSDIEGSWVEATRPDAVLVAANEHVIGTIPDVGFKENLYIGIGYMRIQLDFKLAPT